MLIIFDLDDTLIDTSGSIIPNQLKKAFDKMVDCGLDIENPEEALETLQRIDNKSESSRHALKEFLEIHDQPISLLESLCEVVYKNLDLQTPIYPTTGACEVLTDLFQKRHKLAVVSIGVPHLQLEKMKKAGIDTAFFSRIIVCEDTDKKIYYKQLMEELNVSSHEVVVCGDRIKRDLIPAKALGCRTVHMKWGRGLHQQGNARDIDFTVASLLQLKSVILQLENY